MKFQNFGLMLCSFFLSTFTSASFAAEVRPVFQGASTQPIRVYSIDSVELVEDYFFPNDLLRSYAVVQIKGKYEANCTGVELLASLDQRFVTGTDHEEMKSTITLIDMKGPSEAILVEPKMCSLLTRPMEFIVKLQFHVNVSPINGRRIWITSGKYQPIRSEVLDFSFELLLDQQSGFALQTKIGK